MLLVLSLNRLVDLYGIAGARDQFQRLVTRLVQHEFPGSKEIRVRNGDGGVDTFAGDFGRSIDVWQSKFLRPPIDDSKRDQIRASFRIARRNFRFKLRTWTLAIACDFDQDEQCWFDKWRRKQRGVVVNVWTESEVLRRLHLPDCESIRTEIFHDDIRQRLHVSYERLCTMTSPQNQTVPWDEVRTALLCELDEIESFAKSLLVAVSRQSLDGVSADSDWTTPIWTTFRSEIDQRIRGRRWWSEVVSVYANWDSLKTTAPSEVVVFDGPESAARAVAGMMSCGPICQRLIPLVGRVRRLVAAEIDVQGVTQIKQPATKRAKQPATKRAKQPATKRTKQPATKRAKQPATKR